MIRKVVKYIHYWFTASSPHGVHSPFVFELCSVIMRNKHDYYPWKAIEALRSSLLSSHASISCMDMGAKGNGEFIQKRVQHIAKNAALPKKYGELLFQSVLMLQANTILELGTSLGIGTSYLASANKNSTVYTLEGCPETSSLANQNFQKLGLNHIISVNGNFDDTLPTLLPSLTNLDVVFIDGNHTYEATKRYVNMVLPYLNKEALVIIDDIYWSKDMERIWSELVQTPEATVTIDLYRMGFMFFKPKQKKQHFKLRF